MTIARDPGFAGSESGSVAVALHIEAKEYRMDTQWPHAPVHRLGEAGTYFVTAGWFERTATPAQVKTIYGMKLDSVKVFDEYDAWPEW